MKLYYYTDEIKLDNLNINNDAEILPLDTFINSVRNHLNQIGINMQQTTIFYKRNKKDASVLGIKLHDGDSENLSNYLVYDCQSYISNKSVLCSIDIHASAKVSYRAMKFANVSSNDVTKFFYSMEQSIVENGLNWTELDYAKQIDLPKKKQNVFTKIRDRFQ